MKSGRLEMANLVFFKKATGDAVTVNGTHITGASADAVRQAATRIPGFNAAAIAVGVFFPNQLAHRLAAEMAEAARVGATPIQFGAAGTDDLLNQGTVKYVVLEGGELLIVSHTVSGVEISHAVVSQRSSVIAAGQAEIAVARISRPS